MSTTGKEYRLAIRIAGVIDKSLTTSLAATNRSLKSTVASINNDFTKLDKGFNKIMSVSKKCFNAMTTAAGVAAVAITAATGAAIVVGTKFESAFAGVKKTVEATEEEYEKLRQDILDMAKTIPSTQEEIAGVMEIAGQLGIAKEGLTDFTKTMINMGVSTNLAAEDAAMYLARFSNIMNMDAYGADGISNYERLGSTVVDLGNKFATTEEEIVHIGQSLAAAGGLAGMSEAQIMGISAAMSSVGLTADSGASSMSRLIMQMQQAVAEGGEELGLYAQYSGMTASEFTELFRGDASQALIKFIGGLTEAGEGAYGILEDLDLSTIRLRKSFLSLAGADDLLGNAIEIANEAWEENTALATEAGKRYETTESWLKIMKNSFKDLGIVAFDDLRDPFIDVIHDITGGVQDFTEYVGGPDGISEWLKDIGTELPTLQRKFKKFGEPVFEGMIGAGKWIVKHGNGIISIIAGIGGAMAAYKIASTTTHILTALMSMNPVTLGIVGTVAAIGGIVSAIAAYKLHEQDLINSSLADHFGDIALSMEDIRRVAEYIVSSDSLGGVKEALEAFEDLDVLSSTMEDSVEELNKMNWKVSIGMELTEDEQESYKTAIAEYAATAQEFALQSQYAVSLNIVTGLDGDSNVVSKVNQFYHDSYETMTSLGQQLSDAVNEAFADNILDPSEINVIADLQAKMAEVQQSLATGEFEAQLSMIGMEYAGGSLTADSFQNLQAELAAQVESATAAYKDAYAKNYAAVQATYDAGGYLTDDDYQAALDELRMGYLKNVGELQAKSLNFQMETIMQQYSDELDPAIQEYIDGIQETLYDYSENGEWDWLDRQGILWNGLLYEVMESETLDKTTRGAVSKLLEAMAPTIEDVELLMQQYGEVGAQIPEAVLEGMSSYNMLSAISNNDYESVETVIGQQMAGGEHWGSFYQGMIEKMQLIGGYIPEGIAYGISTETGTYIAPAVSELYSETQNALKESFAAPIDVVAEVEIEFKPTTLTTPKDLADMTFGSGGQVYDPFGLFEGINHRATGGLATSPELTWFAENGPEMAIPIDGSRNAISLWEKTGRLLGMSSAFDGLDLRGGSGHAIEYSPTLQFYGEAPSKSDLEDALRVSQDEFESLMDRYFKTHGRVSFG